MSNLVRKVRDDNGDTSFTLRQCHSSKLVKGGRHDGGARGVEVGGAVMLLVLLILFVFGGVGGYNGILAVMLDGVGVLGVVVGFVGWLFDWSAKANSLTLSTDCQLKERRQG